MTCLAIHKRRFTEYRTSNVMSNEMSARTREPLIFGIVTGTTYIFFFFLSSTQTSNRAALERSSFTIQRAFFRDMCTRNEGKAEEHSLSVELHRAFTSGKKRMELTSDWRDSF
jgi:hypothetical protein